MSETVVKLTPKDIEMIQWMAEGKRDCDTAELMNTSESAVRVRASRVRDKTGTNTREALVAFALRRGIIK